MSDTVELDTETSDLLDTLSQSSGKTRADILKEALLAHSNRAGKPRVVPSDAPLEERRRRIEEALERISRLPILDPRSPDEIIGYDEHGLP